MKMREIAFGTQPPIDGYGPGGFRIGGAWHAGSVILGPEGVEPAELPLDGAAIARLIAAAGAGDLVLFGQGADIAPLPPRLRAPLEAAGLGIEVMSTPSACRTYNVLLAEERPVAALLTAL